MTSSWQAILRTNFTSIEKLLHYLEIEEYKRDKIAHSSHFILNIPNRLVQKMTKNSLEDPLFRQFVPLKEETIHSPGFTSDPVCDKNFQKNEKVLHKYTGRALIVTTGACAMHCRYCFRKNYPYESAQNSFNQAISYIQNDKTIEEVLLSGGDPLSLPDRILENLFHELDMISHVKRIRFHTRFPIGIPERITPSFLTLLEKCKKQIWFVIHSNHSNEFDDDIWAVLQSIQKLGIPVLNQTVLLKGVNDTEEALFTLFSELCNHGIFPYYLHQLDRVTGTHHFEVPIEKGRTLIESLVKRLPGYAIPRYVQEIPFEASKTALVTI